jgi:ribosome-associated protein
MKKHASNDTSLSDDEFYGDDRPSRSAQKREAKAQTDLVPELLELSKDQLKKFIFFDEDFLAGLAMMKKMSFGPGYRRQRNYLGKRIRQEDWAEQIEVTLGLVHGDSKQAVAMHHRCEQWRDRLIAEGDAVLGDLLEVFPHADRQEFRQTIRLARLEKEQSKAPKHARLLFKMLKALHDPTQSSTPIASDDYEENSDESLD